MPIQATRYRPSDDRSERRVVQLTVAIGACLFELAADAPPQLGLDRR
jgi:hypothetical protein